MQQAPGGRGAAGGGGATGGAGAAGAGRGPTMVIAGGPGGAPAAPGPIGPGGADIASLSLRQPAGPKTTAEEREKAQLPAPPEENSVMDVLLRPGLLVESEIIVEKIPNALYVPQQGIFEKAGKTVVYARSGSSGRFEPRVVKLGKRTESQVAILEGLREGEWIALADMEGGRPQPAKKDKNVPRAQPSLPAAKGGSL